MEGLLVLGGVVGAFVLLAALSVTFGVDSREGSTDPRSPERGLTN